MPRHDELYLNDILKAVQRIHRYVSHLTVEDFKANESRAGWHNYSLMLHDDGLLFGYFETPDSLEAATAAMEKNRGQHALAGGNG